MTFDERNLAALIRTVVNSSVERAVNKTRTANLISGTVEDLDTDLDVVYIRADQEAMGGDPTQSDNWGEPGVVPAIRLGETFTGEQVRMEFDGTAGASASRTGIESRVVLPFGKESGTRIVLDGELGTIVFYDDDDEVVAYLASDQWAVGQVVPSGERITIDPLGGFRIHSEDDSLVTIIDRRGYSLRSADTGVVTAEIKPGSFRMVDPAGTDDIEMVTSSTGTLPNPAYAVAIEATPGSSLVVPAAPVFTTTPAVDIEVGHVAAWLRAVNQTATMTPPAGWTERQDDDFSTAAGTLHTSVATRQPATGTAGTFTSTQSNWQHALGTHVVVKGGSGATPAFRSMTEATFSATGTVLLAPLTKPAGVVEGDVLIAFISLGVSGGLVPTGWVTPEGWVFLGADFSSSGSGTSQSTLATGAWVKLATASEPASYSTTINLPTGTKRIHATMIAIQGAFLAPGGVQIRLAGKPIRRLLDYTELLAASTTLCDFQNIPPGYDNLELVWDATANNASGERLLTLRFNGDATQNYYYKRIRNGVVDDDPHGTAPQPTRILMCGLGGGATGSRSSGSVHVYNYTDTVRSMVAVGHGHWVNNSGVDLNDETFSGQWAIPPAAINRVQLTVASGGTQFAVSSKAYLYGY